MALLRTCRCIWPQQQRVQQLLALSTQSSSGSSDGSSSSSTQVIAEAAEAVMQPEQGKATTGSSTAAADEWTEVIEEKSGQTYFWNEKTGETTELGEPRPTTRFKDRNWEQAADTGPFQEGWREPPGRDFTYFYSAVGTGIGILVGWLSQYMH